MFQSTLLGDVAAGLADDDAELSLVVACAVLRTFGDVDTLRIWSDEGGSGLGEELNVCRNRQSGFLSTQSPSQHCFHETQQTVSRPTHLAMVMIVQAETSDVRALLSQKWT